MTNKMPRSVVRSVVGVVPQLADLADALNAFNLPVDWRYDLLPDQFLYAKIHNPVEREKLVYQSKWLYLTGECYSEDAAFLMCHPLWYACIRVSLSNPSLGSIICGIPEKHRIELYSSATLLVTTAGRSVVQKRRAGLQDFGGGGKYAMTFFQRMHSAQRELKMEAGISYSNTAIAYISPPMFVCQNHSGWAFAVLVRIAVVHDDMIETTTDGRVKVGDELMYSLECERAGWPDSGWMFDNMPIFKIIDEREARHPECAVHWRQCDWLTRSLLCDVIDLCRDATQTSSSFQSSR
jgi:hypothetical protein